MGEVCDMQSVPCDAVSSGDSARLSLCKTLIPSRAFFFFFPTTCS